MRKLLLCLSVLLLSSNAYAGWGDVLNSAASSPLLAQQKPLQDIINKVQAISVLFNKMPLNSGKLDLIKAAMPLLTQANTLSTDTAQTGKVSGLLDQVKALALKQWGTTALTAAQLPAANTQVQQFSGLLKSLISNEGANLKKLL